MQRLCEERSKEGTLLLFIELSQSNRAPSQAETTFTQMLL